MHELVVIGLWAIAIIDIAFIIVVMFFEKKDVSATWAWILILIFLPIVGVILYFMIGQGISKNRKFKKKNVSDALKHEYFKKLQSQDEVIDVTDKDKDLILMNYRNSNALYTCDNNMRIIFDGKELYNDMIDEIKKAKKFIHMQFYIFRSDSWGGKLLDEMIKRAEDGVEVKLQVDGMGNFISKDYIKRLEKAGGEFLVFFPSILKTINLRANYRNHRKYLLIDGRCGYLGGFNIGKEYTGEGELGYWRDTHMKLKGEVLQSIEARFILDWTYTQKKDIDTSYSKYFEIEPVASDSDKIPLQIVASGPDEEKEHIKNAYMKIMNKASKSICMQTPYLVPDSSILESLKLAGLSGVEVNIMLPGKPDHFFIPWVANNYIDILLDYGVNIYLYEKGFIHAKTIAVDSEVSSIGTANMDYRSFMLNFETNAVIYSEEKTRELEEAFKADLKFCRKLTREEFDNRSRTSKVLEKVARLIAPLM